MNHFFCRLLTFAFSFLIFSFRAAASLARLLVTLFVFDDDDCVSADFFVEANMGQRAFTHADDDYGIGPNANNLSSVDEHMLHFRLNVKPKLVFLISGYP